jgi:hypothetical protein
MDTVAEAALTACGLLVQLGVLSVGAVLSMLIRRVAVAVVGQSACSCRPAIPARCGLECTKWMTLELVETGAATRLASGLVWYHNSAGTGNVAISLGQGKVIGTSVSGAVGVAGYLDHVVIAACRSPITRPPGNTETWTRARWSGST